LKKQYKMNDDKLDNSNTTVFFRELNSTIIYNYHIIYFLI